MKNLIEEAVKEFCTSSHGSTDYWKEEVYVRGVDDDSFIPLANLIKKHEEVKSIGNLQTEGYVYSSLAFLEMKSFDSWYQKQFNKKLTQKAKKSIGIIHFPDRTEIFKAVEIVDQVYQILKDHKVLVNGKNLPVQLGE